MAFIKIENIAIRSVVACVPRQIEHTRNYNHISSEEQELFIKTTGIKERRVAASHVTCSDLCFAAAEDIFKENDCRDDIDVVIFVSQSPDYYLPATSIVLQEKLKLKKDCLAFDVSLGCSGYVYGLSVVGKLLENGQLKKALLLVGDKSTTSTNYSDKSTYPLFGDAGTATLLEYDKGASSSYFNLQSDGSGKSAIIIEHGHSRNPFDKTFEEVEEIEPGISRAKKHLSLNGMDIFNFALMEVAPNIQRLLNDSAVKIETIDYFIFHQANKLINESVRKKLKVDVSKVPYSIDLFGNTSSASIPLTMCYALKNELKSNKKLLLCGFGVGYSWGSAIVETNNLYTNLLEHD